MLTIENIYQSKLEKFRSVAEAGAQKLGNPGAFANILGSLEESTEGCLTGSMDTRSLSAATSPYFGLGLGAGTNYGIADYLSGVLQNAASSAKNPSFTPSEPEIDSAIAEASSKTGLDEGLIRAVIQVESSFRTDAISRCGAMGLMQLMPGTAEEMDVSNPFDARQNVLGGAGYLKKLVDRFGDVRLALAAYNTGQGRIASLGITNANDAQQYSRISPGVRGYVDKVLSFWENS